MKYKSRDLPFVILTMSHSEARLSLRTKALGIREKNLEVGARRNYTRPVAFRPHLSVGLVLSRKVSCVPPLRPEP
jgi:hypothetical protein